MKQWEKKSLKFPRTLCGGLMGNFFFVFNLYIFFVFLSIMLLFNIRRKVDLSDKKVVLWLVPSPSVTLEIFLKVLCVFACVRLMETGRLDAHGEEILLLMCLGSTSLLGAHLLGWGISHSHVFSSTNLIPSSPPLSSTPSYQTWRQISSHCHQLRTKEGSLIAPV